LANARLIKINTQMRSGDPSAIEMLLVLLVLLMLLLSCHCRCCRVTCGNAAAAFQLTRFFGGPGPGQTVATVVNIAAPF